MLGESLASRSTRIFYCFLNTTLKWDTHQGLIQFIVLSRHGSNLARPVIIHDINHGLIYVPSTPYCGFSGVSPDGNCAYVQWGSFTSNSKSVRRAILFTWFCEPHECIQHLAVPGGHPSNYETGATLLNFRRQIEQTPMSERCIPYVGQQT